MSTEWNKSTSSENEILLGKVFLAGCHKKFIGNGSKQLTKAVIKKLDISNLAEIVDHESSNSPLTLAITYFLGLCKIYEKAVIFFQEDLMQFQDELNAVLYNVGTVSSKSKKTREFDTESILSKKLCDEADLISLFSKNHESDRYLLNEIDIYYCEEESLPDFGDEIHLQNGRSDDCIEKIRSGPAGFIPSVSGEVIRNVAGNSNSSTGTPKRKTRMSHDETPTKRQKKSPSYAVSSEEKRSVSRRLFEPEPGSSMPTEEIMLQNDDQHGVQSFDERIPVQDFQEQPPRKSIQLHVDTAIQDFDPDRESELPALDASLQNVQPLPTTSLQNSDMELPKLNDESLTALPLKRRRRKKFADEKTKIPLAIDIKDIPAYYKLHTKEFVSPTTILKSSRPYTWGKKLQNLYFKMARPILHPISEETYRASSVPRDVNVDKKPRISSFGIISRWGTIVSSTSENQNTTLGDMDDNNVDRDRELMPPPQDRPMLSRSSDEQPAPCIPGKSHDEYLRPPSLPSSSQQQSSRQQSPSTPTHGRYMHPDISSVSPKQMPLVPDDTIQPAIADEAPMYPDLSDAVEMSPRSTASARARSLLMTEDTFYTFLEGLWNTWHNNVDLDVIIIPHEASLTAFYRYFNYLQMFQIERKLTMLQEIIYGRVQIVKGTQK